MSMILLEPAKHDLHNSLEDQAADHLINGVVGNFRTLCPLARALRWNDAADSPKSNSKNKATIIMIVRQSPWRILSDVIVGQ
jgi:hypothetical protein